MAKSHSKAPSQRQLKVGEVLRHALSETFMRGDIYAADLGSTPITVSEVRVSPDLRNATVYIMPLGGKEKEETIERINKISPLIRTEVTRKVELRFSPELFFKLDETLETASKLENILNRPDVRKDIEGSSE